MTDEELLNKPTGPVDNSLSRRQLWLRVGIGFLIILSFSLVKPIYGKIKIYRAGRLLSDSKSLAEEGKFQDSFHRAMAAYHMQPANPEGIRMIARLLQGREESLAFWRLLISTDQANLSDYEQYLQHADFFHREEHAKEAVAYLLENGRQEQNALWLLASHYRNQGDLTQSISFLIEALALNPLNEPSRFHLASQMIELDTPSSLSEAILHLRTLLSNSGKFSLQALQLIVATGGISSEQAIEYSSILSSIPGTDDEKQIVRLRLDLLMQPNQEDALSQARDQVDDNTADENAEIARQLRSSGRFQEVIEMLPLFRALTHPELFQARLDSMADLAKQYTQSDSAENKRLWAQVYAELGHKLSPLPEVSTQIFMARAARESKRVSLEGIHWRKAHKLSGDIPNAKYVLARYAESIGATNEAYKAYRDLADKSDGGPQALLQLVRLSKIQRKTRELRGLMAELTENYPDDEVYLNDLSYLELLLNLDVEKNKERAFFLYEAESNFLAHRVTLALAYLRLGEPTKALPLFEGMNPKLWEKTSDAMQAVHVAVQAAVGNNDLAKILAKGIDLSALLPEEIDLVKAYLD